jgi:hypothetical protein
MSPRRGSKPRSTDRLVVGRNVTLTLTVRQLRGRFQLRVQRVVSSASGGVQLRKSSVEFRRII